MTVAELILFLSKQPQELQVAYALYSEYCLLEKEDLGVKKLCQRRSDGWLQNERPDKPSESYLVFPGN